MTKMLRILLAFAVASCGAVLRADEGMWRLNQVPLDAIAKKYGVSHVICGHAHQWMRMVNDGVVYMVVGSSGANMRRGMQAGQGFKE